MVVNDIVTSVVMKLTRSLGTATRDNAKGPRHSQVHQQDVAGGQFDQQIFCPARHALDRPAFQSGGEIRRERPTQGIAASFDAVDAGTGHGAVQQASNDFDFGELGHGRGVPIASYQHGSSVKVNSAVQDVTGVA